MRSASVPPRQGAARPRSNPRRISAPTTLLIPSQKSSTPHCHCLNNTDTTDTDHREIGAPDVGLGTNTGATRHRDPSISTDRIPPCKRTPHRQRSAPHFFLQREPRTGGGAMPPPNPYRPPGSTASWAKTAAVRTIPAAGRHDGLAKWANIKPLRKGDVAGFDPGSPYKCPDSPELDVFASSPASRPPSLSLARAGVGVARFPALARPAPFPARFARLLGGAGPGGRSRLGSVALAYARACAQVAVSRCSGKVSV